MGARGIFQHPSLIPGRNPNAGPKTTDQWFNIYAFAKCDDTNSTAFGLAAPTYCFGTVGRNTMIGPGFKNFDISLHKTTKIGERHEIQFRAEFFNAFNNVNFGNPNSTFTDLFTDPKTGKTTFTNNVGTISSTANNSREIQFALKYIF